MVTSATAFSPQLTEVGRNVGLGLPLEPFLERRGESEAWLHRGPRGVGTYLTIFNIDGEGIDSRVFRVDGMCARDELQHVSKAVERIEFSSMHFRHTRTVARPVPLYPHIPISF